MTPRPPLFRTVGVNHGGRDVTMAKEFLDGPDVGVGLQQVSRKGVPEGVARCR